MRACRQYCECTSCDAASLLVTPSGPTSWWTDCAVTTREVYEQIAKTKLKRLLEGCRYSRSARAKHPRKMEMAFEFWAKRVASEDPCVAQTTLDMHRFRAHFLLEMVETSQSSPLWRPSPFVADVWKMAHSLHHSVAPHQPLLRTSLSW